MVLLDSSCFQTRAHTNSVIITLLWKWGVNEERIWWSRRRVDRQWLTDRLSHLCSPIIAYIVLMLYTYCQQVWSALSKIGSMSMSVWQWAICIKRKLIKNLFCLLSVSPDALSRLTLHTTHGRKNIITHGTPSLRDGIIYIYTYVYVYKERERERENAIVQLISDSFHVVLIEWVSWAELIVDYRHRHRLYHIRSTFDDWIWQVAPAIYRKRRSDTNQYWAFNFVRLRRRLVLSSFKFLMNHNYHITTWSFSSF